jgi:hypothetical protein
LVDLVSEEGSVSRRDSCAVYICAYLELAEVWKEAFRNLDGDEIKGGVHLHLDRCNISSDPYEKKAMRNFNREKSFTVASQRQEESSHIRGHQRNSRMPHRYYVQVITLWHSRKTFHG